MSNANEEEKRVNAYAKVIGRVIGASLKSLTEEQVRAIAEDYGVHTNVVKHALQWFRDYCSETLANDEEKDVDESWLEDYDGCFYPEDTQEG